MRRAISDDCTGEPPGELRASATAFTPGIENARSIERARRAGAGPLRTGPTPPMTPLRRKTATTGITGRRGPIGRRASSERSPSITGFIPLSQPGAGLEDRQRRAVAQDRACLRRVAFVVVVEDKPVRHPHVRFVAAPADHDDALGCRSGLRPDRRDLEPAPSGLLHRRPPLREAIPPLTQADHPLPPPHPRPHPPPTPNLALP